LAKPLRPQRASKREEIRSSGGPRRVEQLPDPVDEARERPLTFQEHRWECSPWRGSRISGRAKERGVDVRLIADKTTPCERASEIEPLAAAGVPIWIDAQARIAHAKTMVIDSAVTLMGSMNWTLGAVMNSEALSLVSSPTVAAAYAGHWRERLAVSSPFNRREDRCQAGSVT
jgi:phosphatidylserine/phosphatidylglycerophosphate/cardiolipin synthase-like enzyme